MRHLLLKIDFGQMSNTLDVFVLSQVCNHYTVVLIHLCDASLHSNSSSSPLPLNLLHVLEWALSHNPLKDADIPVAFSPFATFFLPFNFLLVVTGCIIQVSSISFCVFPSLCSMSAIVSYDCVVGFRKLR